MAIKFEKTAADKVLGASIEVSLRSRSRPCYVPLRIDARGETVRVDMGCTLTCIWSAIDGGRGFATVAEAKRFAERWARAAIEQRTLDPKGVS